MVESSGQSSLHQNCHHQIVLARFSLKVVFPSPYEFKYGILKKQMLTILEKKWFLMEKIISKYERQ